MKKYHELLNEGLKKLMREAEGEDPEVLEISDEPEEFEISDEPVEDDDIGVVDIHKHITKQVSDDNWDVYIPRTKDMLNALAFSDSTEINPSAAIYIFENKREGGKNYVFVPKTRSFGELLPGTKRWSYSDGNGEIFVNFIVEKTSKRIQDWVIKRFPNTYGRLLRITLLVNKSIDELNHVFTYPENAALFQDIRNHGSRRIKDKFVEQINKIVVSEGTTEIGSGSFSSFGVSQYNYGHKNRVEVVLPKSLKIIGDTSFSGSGVEDIILPDGVTSLGYNAFANSSIKTINIPDSITHVEMGCFSGCHMSEFVFPKKVAEIPSFYYSSNNSPTNERRKFVIPNSVVRIDDYAFNYIGDTDIYIPKSVVTIDRGAFSRLSGSKIYCEATSKPDGWADSVFNYPGNNVIVWGGYKPGEKIMEDKNKDIEADGEEEFEISDEPFNPDDVSVFTKADIVKQAQLIVSDKEWEIWKPKSDIGMKLLAEGTNWLKGRWSIGYNDGVEMDDIESRVMRNWKRNYVILNKNKLEKKFLFEAGYGQIYSPSGAQYSCSTWVIKQNSDKLLKWFANGNFPWVSNRLKPIINTKKVTAAGNVYHYPTDGEIAWNVRNNTIDSVIIEPGTTKITRRGLAGFKKITEIQIPDTVKSINSYAFSGCTGIKHLTLPEGLTTIGAAAFNFMESLESINIPSSVKKIGAEAFYDCAKLKKIFIPRGVTSIGGFVFSGWSSGAAELTIYCECEATSQPDGWSEQWRTVSHVYNRDTGSYDTPYRKINVVWGATRLPD